MNCWEVQIECLKGDFHLQVELSGGLRPMALIGANGSGKSTILRGVLGLETLKRAFVRVVITSCMTQRNPVVFQSRTETWPCLRGWDCFRI